jgi:hypothetical protein
MWLTDLADGLRAHGLTVIEVPGWKTRGYAGLGMTAITGTIAHHTATHRSAFDRSDAPTLNMCTHGRAGLAGPLCHIVFGRTGVCYVVAAGWANHAGTGKWTDIPWHHGNDYTVGVEMESSGITPWDWTDDQIRVAPHLYAALEEMYGHRNTVSHQEYSDAGKIDPAGWPGGMDGLRDQISRVRRGAPAVAPQANTVRPIPEEDVMASKEEVAEGVWDEEIGLGKQKYQTGSYLLWTHKAVTEQAAQIKGLVGAIAALSKGEPFDEAKLLAGVEAAARRGVETGFESVTRTETTTAKVK